MKKTLAILAIIIGLAGSAMATELPLPVAIPISIEDVTSVEINSVQQGVDAVGTWKIDVQLNAELPVKLNSSSNGVEVRGRIRINVSITITRQEVLDSQSITLEQYYSEDMQAHITATALAKLYAHLSE